MSSNDVAGDDSSSSNTTPSPVGESPLRHRRGGEVAPHFSPYGRGYSPTHPRETGLFTAPRPRDHQVRPPSPQWRPPGPVHGPSGIRSLGVGCGSGGDAVGGGIRIGGNPASERKRGREGCSEAIVQYCSVCRKAFGSSKALFGHVRSHLKEEDVDAAEEDVDAGVTYKVPDLNHPPPQD